MKTKAELPECPAATTVQLIGNNLKCQNDYNIRIMEALGYDVALTYVKREE